MSISKNPVYRIIHSCQYQEDYVVHDALSINEHWLCVVNVTNGFQFTGHEDFKVSLQGWPLFYFLGRWEEGEGNNIRLLYFGGGC